MTNPVLARIEGEVQAAREDGTLKILKTMETPIGPEVDLKEAGHVILMSSNDYLGLSNHPDIVEAAKEALLKYGASTASVRFICGTQTIHQELESALAGLHGTETSLTYSSCWAANTGLMPIIVVSGTTGRESRLSTARPPGSRMRTATVASRSRVVDGTSFSATSNVARPSASVSGSSSSVTIVAPRSSSSAMPKR